jgi:translocator protein
MTATQSMEGPRQGLSSVTRSSAVPAAPRAGVTRPTGAVTAAPERSAARSALALVLLMAIAAGVAAVGSVLSAPGIAGWYAETPKPMWTPPDAVFAPVWTLLYALMSVAAWLVWRRPDSPTRTRALRVYAVQLGLNAVWSPAFFGLGALLGAPGAWVALVVIVVLDFAILATMIRFGDVSRLAAALLLPYWVWALFATTLNAAIAVLAR